jgi:vacuolar-type H+-ATPase subunit F/Vma7
MARLVTLTGPALADGFRLSGVATVVARTGPEVLAALRELEADEETGLVLVSADLWAALEERTRDRFESLARPIVLVVPAGAPTDLATRRELVVEMLRRAIGYRIQLEESRS